MNDVDVRDERLGQLLDRAVRDVRPRIDASVPVHGGRRRRAARLVGSVAVVCVFVASVVWAASQVREHPGPTSVGDGGISPVTTYHDPSDGFSVMVPDGWQVADEPINTWVSDPWEILAMATYPLRPGGHAVIDGQVPSNAMDDLGPNDIFIWANESIPGGDGERPAHFSPDSVCPDAPDCVQGHSLGIERVRAWWYYFAEDGREVYVFVAMGEDAYKDPSRSQQPWEILDSLRFDTGLYGVHALCPSTDGAVPAGDDAARTSEAAANAFVQASVAGDEATVAQLSDPVAVDNRVHVPTSNVDLILGSASAARDPALRACGQAVADSTWTVTVDDANTSPSVDVVLYLIRRTDGWKVWGAY